MEERDRSSRDVAGVGCVTRLPEVTVVEVLAISEIEDKAAAVFPSAADAVCSERAFAFKTLVSGSNGGGPIL